MASPRWDNDRHKESRDLTTQSSRARRTIRLALVVRTVAALALLGAASGCQGNGDDGFVVLSNPGGRPIPVPTPQPTPRPSRTMIDFTFQQRLDPWQTVFAGFAAEREPFLRLNARLASLPRELNTSRGLLFSSEAATEGHFSGARRQVSGLRPHTSYKVEFRLTLAANVARGCNSAAGRAGEDQIVKAGASSVVPEPNRTGLVRLPLDKGVATGSGRNMVAVGDLVAPELTTCAPTNRFYARAFSSRGNGPTVAADSLGRLWLIMGVDSTYGGQSRYYILDGRYELVPA